MTLMIAGLLLFFAIHLVPWSIALRESLVSRMGLNGYKGVFSLIALVGVVLIVIGKGRAGFVPVWQPPPEFGHVTRLLVLIGFVLLPAAHMKTNIKRFTRHPMLWGVVLWGVGHLLANGDKASMVLFGSFVVYSLAAMVSANARGAQKSTVRYGIGKDLVVVAAGVVTYAALMLLHGTLFGYPLI
ncbi:MAG: hypothetical protein DWQ08_12760 [Proteobacteria bacterium]|nr:MAG: hypothetical protein DWQ08_12760 [Pseudomonadota bacterium]